MDIAEYIEKLKVSDDLFKDVKFFVTGKVPEEVLKLLTDGGAKQDAHITDYMTHLVTGEDPNENEIGEVKDIYEKPVVTSKWVVLSAKCGKQLPWAGFSPDTTQVFSGVTACMSQLGHSDTLAVWAMITFAGGQCSLELDNSCTHLILGKPEGAKYICALEHEEQISIVTPDWVPDCLAEGIKVDEIDYHPRLLKQPKSHSNQTSEPSAIKEKRKKDPSHQKSEELKKKEDLKKKEPEKKSLFDALEFSDEDEENSKGGSLLDQLKTPQTWKQPSTKPTVTTRASATSSATTSIPHDKPRAPPTAPISTTNTPQTVTARSVTPQPISAPKGIAQGPPQALLQSTTQGLPQVVGQGTSHIAHPVATFGPPPIIKSTGGTSQISSTIVSVSNQGPHQGSSTDTVPLRNSAQLLNQTPASVPTSVTEVSSGTSAQVNISRPTPATPSRVTPPATARVNPPNMSRATPPNTTRVTPPNNPRATPPNNARATPPNTSRATPPIVSRATTPLSSRTTPPTPSRATPPANSRTTPPITSRATPPITSRATPPANARVTPPVTTRTTPPNIVGGGPRVPTMPLTVTGPSVRAPGAVSQVAPGSVPTPNMPSTVPQQVHTVAIPGAVVRLPQGVTPQQLTMMTPNDRQAFLQNLHQKQLQEQQARGKPRAGKPPGPQYKQGVRYVSPGMHTAATPGTPPTPGTPVSTWPGPSQATPGIRPTMTTVGPGTVAVAYPAGQLRAQGPGAPPVASPGTPGEGVRPGWPGQAQQQYQGQPAPGTRVVVGQAGWQPQQQQQQQQQQTGLRPQAPAAPGQQPTPQGLLPQHMQQLHLQIQQLCQHFPHLTHQDASQLIQRIPAHFRHIQQLDNAQRSDYLAQLDSKERQVVTYFVLKKQQQQLFQRQQLLQQQHQQQQKVGTPQQSPHAWQQQQQPGQQPGQQQNAQGAQYPPISPHGRPIPGRPLPQGYPGCQPAGVVSPGQGSPHMVASGQLTPQQQLTPHVSPLASPHGHSPIQRGDGPLIGHAAAIQGSPVPQNLVNQQNLVNPKTKTALAIHLTNRLAGGVHQGVLPPGPQAPQGPMEVPAHVVQKPGIPQETVQGPGGEPVMLYQRRALGNITGSVTNNLVRPPVQGTPAGVVAGHGYPRPAAPAHPSAPTPVMAPAAPHYPRPHLVGHDTNIMLPRELCLVGCVFYIADYHGEITLETLHTWKRVIQQHGGEVMPLYDSARVTHLLCKHQKSPVFMQAVRENKRCITIFWLNDVLLRGKMAPPWQAIHLPTPFGNDNKPCKDLIVSVSGFENEERTIIKLMLQLVGAKYTGYFSKHNSLLVCKKLEGAKVAKAREWKRPVVNGVWLSEVLLGQNTPPLVYHGTRYQHYLDDPLRIDPSLASHLFNAWKYPISVSKESVEKAKAVREMALRKRKTEADGDQENKRARLDPPPAPHLSAMPTPTPQQPSTTNQLPTPPSGLPHGNVGPGGVRGNLTVINKELPPEQHRPRILLSSVKNKEDVERKLLELGGYLARSSVEATHLVMGTATAHRTVKFMCAISSCRYVVSLQWIIDSHMEAKFLPEENYFMDMPEYERVFKFSLRETLMKPNRRQLFTGKTFYLTPSVVPGRTWLREIIECAGGTVESKRRTLKDIKEKNKDGMHKYLTIAAESDVHLVKDLLQENMPVYNAEFVLGSILKQEIDLQMAMYVDGE